MAEAAHTGSTWFEVDQKGLRSVLARRGPEFLLYELVANAWDEAGVCRVDVGFQVEKPGPKTQRYLLTVTDDAPQGFADLRHAYTMFAPSKKIGEAETRGRFNVGEKLVMAYAESGWVRTMQGTIRFSQDGGRTFDTQVKTERGTVVGLVVNLTEKEAKQVDRAARLLLPPEKVITAYNNQVLQRPKRLFELSGILPTELAGDDGQLKPTKRLASVQLFDAHEEQPWLFELGIPVCETDMPWHVNVMQKIPLTLDRESVRPAFLKVLYVTVMNAAFSLLTTKEQATEPWARTAAGHPECTAEATKHLTLLRFGDKVVAYDPSDPEANARAMAAGYTVVHGGALSGGEWKNVKAIGNIQPAGQVHGSPRPFVDLLSGQARDLKMVGTEQMTQEQRETYLYIFMLAAQLLRKTVTVQMADDRRWVADTGEAVRACYGDGVMIVNWFYLKRDPEDLHSLIIHELAHDFSSNHLDDAFHDGLSTLGARLAILVAAKPELYQKWLWPKEG